MTTTDRTITVQPDGDHITLNDLRALVRNTDTWPGDTIVTGRAKVSIDSRLKTLGLKDNT